MSHCVKGKQGETTSFISTPRYLFFILCRSGLGRPSGYGAGVAAMDFLQSVVVVGSTISFRCPSNNKLSAVWIKLSEGNAFTNHLV